MMTHRGDFHGLLAVHAASVLLLVISGCSSGQDTPKAGNAAGNAGSGDSASTGASGASGSSAPTGGSSAATDTGGNAATTGGNAATTGGGSATDGGAPGLAGSPGSGGSGAAAGGSAGGAPGPKVAVDASGKYTVTFTRPPWVFGGSLGAPATAIASTTGSDGGGAYHETTFTYTSSGTRNARIRSYDGAPVVVFAETNPASGSNIRNFPKLSTVPSASYHLTHQDVQFAPYTFSGLTGDSPWLFFDDSANAFILSAGSHFMNAQTSRDGSGALAVGISSQISMLPASFEQTAVLVADVGINRAWDDWGATLMKLGGKKPNPSDLSPDLAMLGYWTDNHAAYYYKTESGKDYQTTLKDVKAFFQQQGTPLGSIQLDSWWYPKGSANTWEGSGTDRGGEYLYQGDKTLFPNGLGSFQQSLGLPLVAHARWIDSASPYRTMYKVSGGVAIDPAFWTSIASYLKSNGVATYEQDWLNANAMPLTTNLTDQDAFTDNMAKAMADAGLSIQYCMALPRHYLQSSKYQNLVTARVSEDGFARDRWRPFFYSSRLAWSVGLWPWTDSFDSSDHDGLLLSTLTGSMMGVGDAIGSIDKASILRAIRADGVLIKPDAPILLLDKSILAEAQGKTGLSIATTYSDHAGGRTTYVFGFTGSSASMSFTPAELGYSGSVYVLDVNHSTGRVLTSSQPNTDTVSNTAYYIVAPVGQSGIAFLGEKDKVASTGKKRIADWSDDGTLSVSVVFASGESSVTLSGYAPSAPTATATSGAVGSVQYDSAQKRFTLAVMPSASAASIRLHL
ncbi:MAG: hypothetical protein ABJB12_16745 [Pseudomonadota bacterium]